MARKTFWISIIVAVILLLFLFLASNVMQVGERLVLIHPFLAYAFYGLAVILIFILIINPLRIIFLAPTFKIEALNDEKNQKTYQKAARIILKLDYLKEEEQEALEAHLHDEKLEETVKSVFQGSIRKEVDAVIIKNAQTVLLTTAISQNGNLDMLAVIFSNIKMIKDITKRCGFRVGYARLAKLTLNVMVTALIAEGLEDLDVNQAMPSKLGETIRDIPVVRSMTNSVFQGISNGMLTCRVGIVTRKYLFLESKMVSPRQVRLQAYTESFRLMPKIVSGGLANFPKGFYNYLVKPFVRNPFNRKDEQTHE